MLKRLVSVLLTCLFLLTLPPVGASAVSLPQFVRIGLMYGSTAPQSMTLESAHGFVLGSYQEREFSQSQVTAQTQLTVAVSETGIQVSDSTGAVLVSGVPSVGIKPNASGKEQKLKINGTEYRCGLHCIAAGTTMTVVNVVFLDHYLYGVVSREMSSSWHQQALKAQAVCARNYVTAHLNKHQADGFDLCSGVHCQAYAGTRVESASSYAPVDETTRQILTYGGSPVALYYSSSMGKRTEDVKNVWGNSVPYLISVDNSHEDTANIPNGIWNGTLTPQEATDIMRSKGHEVGDVTNIEVLEYTENGRVLTMRVTGTAGFKDFQRERCRTLFNTVTKSQEFTVKPIYEEGSQTANKIQLIGGEGEGTVEIGGLTILSASGRSQVTGDTLIVSNGVTQTAYVKGQATDGTLTGFRFDGVGWGHGVGMSQYGAKGMAEAGYTYDQILLHYFPGTILETV